MSIPTFICALPKDVLRGIRASAEREIPRNHGAPAASRPIRGKRMTTTDDIHQRLTVPFDYTVCFTRNSLAADNPVLRDAIRRREPERRHRVLFLIEQAIADHRPDIARQASGYCAAFPEYLLAAGEPVIAAGGEAVKSFEAVMDFCRLIADRDICRQSHVVIVGGGAFMDSAGFAAAIVHRGVRQVRMPTTVLGQNDSGVGVKNGVNLFGKKNFVGCFAPPFAVVNDYDFLDSLPHREWIAGIAEAFKVAMIKDAAFFDWLCASADALKRRNASSMETLVSRCAALHLDHIAGSGDPFEFGSARPLDFGHWAAHKLEMLTDGELRHGEAVAIGLLLDSHIATAQGLLSPDVLERLGSALESLGFSPWSDAFEQRGPDGRRLVLDGIREFREHLGGELNITLPDGLGRKVEIHQLDDAPVERAIAWLRHRGDRRNREDRQ